MAGEIRPCNFLPPEVALAGPTPMDPRRSTRATALDAPDPRQIHAGLLRTHWHLGRVWLVETFACQGSWCEAMLLHAGLTTTSAKDSVLPTLTSQRRVLRLFPVHSYYYYCIMACMQPSDDMLQDCRASRKRSDTPPYDQQPCNNPWTAERPAYATATAMGYCTTDSMAAPL